MKYSIKSVFVIVVFGLFFSCSSQPKKIAVTAKTILGNPEYQAISYGGYRGVSRDIQPTVAQLKEDMKILWAMDIKVLRTYNVQLKQASNLLKAIRELKKENADFEMYVMLGAWIDCENAWTAKTPNHNKESVQNKEEINRAVALAKKYPDIVKIIAVGNEAMVRWASSYYVQPKIILKWVNYLQQLKKQGVLSKNLWITSSDDFASWGGGDKSYHTKDLEQLVKAVDYISMHTYPMHNTYYNPKFWVVPTQEKKLSKKEKIDNAMNRAVEFAKNQYNAVSNYVKSLGVNKPIHIGESGWTTHDNNHYGANSSCAGDEYKAGVYYQKMRQWTNKNGIAFFYFEAFDEQWKDADNLEGSENHFGLINLKGEAKYAIWNLVDNSAFKGLKRGGKSITKTYNGSVEQLLKEIASPPNSDFKGFTKKI